MTTMTHGAGMPAWRRAAWRRLLAGLDALARAWRERLARRRRDAEFLDPGRLSERMLRDIGVPQRLDERGPGAPRWDLERPRW
ncbi:MAG: hypothetical protein ABT20_14135 [Rubrivivax sp. SCN 70-15]|nr:MAG: hypothetical protein ABT20_14135 [Rubrivivax sp. SCN 70-15]